MRDGAYGRPRCEWCSRVLTWREFHAGLARSTEGMWAGYEMHDYAEHTYDCENEPRQVPA